jgi:hypothetical protein
MNIIKLMSLNKHGDYQEVLFTSCLSYLLSSSSESDHGLNDSLLKEFIKPVYAIKDKSPLELTSEAKLGSVGNIDILLENDEIVIGIEVKIWDRSAKNISKDNRIQLERYCAELSKKSKNWKLIYLIPNEGSKTCLSEYDKIKQKYSENAKIMVWNYTEKTNFNNYFIEESVFEILKNYIKKYNSNMINPQANWIINSLIEIIPDISKEIKENGRFPCKDDLQHLVKTWPIFELFIKYYSRWPSTLHTVIGIPYGRSAKKSAKHDNCLFRIRTTKSYYRVDKEKNENLPTEYVEIELWEDVYNNCSDSLLAWMKENGINEKVTNSFHLDDKYNIPVKIMKIDCLLSNQALEKYDNILRSGFEIA